MKHYRRQTRYVSIVTVHVPSADALYDMLRYECCCPDSEAESQKISAISWSSTSARAGEPLDHVIRLRRFAPSEYRTNADRWRSFGCTVLDERSPEQAPLTDVEILNLAKIAQVS